MTTLATDDFNRANANPIGGNWTTMTSLSAMQIVSNVATPSSLSSDAGSFWNAITWPNDQYSQAQLTVTDTLTDGSGIGVYVRCSSVALTAYRVVLTHASPGTNVSLQRFLAGGFTRLWDRGAGFNDGDTVRLEVQGTTLRVLINGVQVGADFTDTNIVSGSAGIGYSGVATAASLDNWEGGSLPALVASKPVFFHPTNPPWSRFTPMRPAILTATAGPDQTVLPVGISTAEAFGNPSAAQSVAPIGISSQEQFGNPTVTQVVSPYGITSSERFGNATTTLFVTPIGITTQEQFGNPTVSQVVSPKSIATQEQFGNPTTTQFVTPYSIPTQEQFGNPTVFTAVTITAYGIPSQEAFGQPIITQVVVPVGIVTSERFGQPTITQFITPYGIPTSEQFGNPSIQVIAAINPYGIPSPEAFGNPTITQPIQPRSITTSEALGNPIVQTAAIVSPYGIPTSERFGNASVTAGPVTVTPYGISTQQAFGNPSVSLGAIPGVIAPYGISSALRIGHPFVGYEVVIDFDYDNTTDTISYRSDPAVQTTADPVTISSRQDETLNYSLEHSI